MIQLSHYLILGLAMKVSILSIIFPFSLFASTQGSFFNNELTLWIALFILGLIAVVILYYSSRAMMKMKQEHRKMQQKQDEIIEIQNKILQKMSEDIHKIAEQAVQETKDLVLSSEQDSKLRQALKKVAQSENKLLDISTDLLEFLRLKSNKVEIKNENFQLINLLNDITGQVSVTDRHIDFDLLYDIDESVPSTLLGDTLHISKVAVNVIDYLKQSGAKSVVVSIKREGGFTSAKLSFEFQSDLLFDIENDPNIFLSRYNEITKQYDGLNLYIAKELALKMGGDIVAKNGDDKRAYFRFWIPFKKVALTDFVFYHDAIPKEFENLKIFLVDKNKECYAIDTKLFQKLHIDLEATTRREFNHQNFDFSPYGIVIIDEALFTTDLLKRLSGYEGLKVISLSSIFVESKFQDMVDAELKRPLTDVQIKETLLRVLETKEEKQKKELKTSLPVHREKFTDTPNVTLESFADFASASLLVVEDNFINQKVLLSVLKKSQMDIDIANNGLEAVELIQKGKKYDLVLMDINMPVMDGYTATLKIREAGYHDIPIVALTALTSTDEINRMFDVGMNGYLAKPFYKERLYTVFSTFIHKDGTQQTPPKTQQHDSATKKLNLHSLDIAKGLQNSKNCELFYKEILEEFSEAFGSSGALYEKLVYDFRYEQIKMLMVDIRGLSGAIGAEKLYNMSMEILQAILFKKYEKLQDFVEPFKDEMQQLQKDIELYLKVNE